MKLSKFRKSYIIDKTYGLTLTSTILTAFAPLIATLVDGLFCSHILGNDAFIAISVMLPVVNAVGVLTLICCRGGAVLAAKRLANNEIEKPNQIFTISLFSAMLVAIITVIAMGLNVDSVAHYLSGHPERAAYVKEYLSIILIYFLVLPINNTLSDFSTYEGYPQLTANAVLIGCTVNVLLDTIFIGVLHLGIIGAAWGTVASGIVTLLILLPHYLAGKSKYRLSKSINGTISILWNNLKHGFGFNVFYIVVNAFMLLGNALVLHVAGTGGLTLFNVCLQIQSATFSVVVGLCIAGISHITYLRTIDDIQGLRRIMDHTFSIVVVFYGILTLMMIVFPQFFLWCFGLGDAFDYAFVRKVFICFGIYYFCFCTMSVYVTVVLQLAGYVGVKILLVFGMGITTYLCMLGFSFVSPDAMWLGMIVGSVPILIASIGFGFYLHKSHPGFTRFTLVDKYPNRIKFECSLDYERRHIEDFRRELHLFAEACEMPPAVLEKISTAAKVLYQNAIDNREKDLKYMDISLCELDDSFSLTIKDCGHPNNPLVDKVDAKSLGAISASHRYVFSMNVTSLVWSKQ